ncbi:MAG: hypothetical protein PUC44_06605 [Eubacteriales bacterium]|nr:hypothetical protein [Eubacteriales bacterium]
MENNMQAMYALIGNEKIEEAVSAFQKNGTEDELIEVLETIRTRMNDGGTVIVPIEKTSEDSSQREYAYLSGMSPEEMDQIGGDVYLKIRLNGGKQAVAAFTLPEETSKGPDAEMKPVEIRGLLERIFSFRDVDGIILNPWTREKSFFLEKSLIQLLLQVDEEAKKEEEKEE